MLAGMADEPTWRRLLGDEEYEATYGHLGSSSSSSTSSSDMRQAVSDEATTNPQQGGDDSGIASSAGGGGGDIRRSGGWPVLMDMDGGREVHALQVSLLCHIGMASRDQPGVVVGGAAVDEMCPTASTRSGGRARTSQWCCLSAPCQLKACHCCCSCMHQSDILQADRRAC